MTVAQEAKLFKTLAVAVRAAMKDRDLGLRELARAADVPVGTLHHWIGTTGTKSNHGRPRFAVVAAVFLALDVRIDPIVKAWGKSRD